MTTTFETAQVGDRVYDLDYGWCEIASIHQNSKHPININVTKCCNRTYTYDGKCFDNQVTQCLFWDEVTISPPTKPMTTTTFETAQVGDRVYHYKYGWLTITNIRKESNYPIIIDYDFSFTYDGYADKSDKNRTLFWDEVVINAPTKPFLKLEVDTKVFVWDNDYNMKQKMHFSHFEANKNICVFVHGGTSWSSTQTVEYHHWELAKD